MDKFLKEKKDFLKKTDKSKKHSYDKKIIRLVNLINSRDNYYTTSSCSGRIRIFEKNNKRYNVNDIFVNHNKIKINNKIIDDIMNKIINDMKGTNKKIIIKNNEKTKNKRFNLDVKNIDKINVKNNNNKILNKIINNNLNKKIKNNLKINNKLYFQYESLILHICCRTIEDANKLLNLARKIGLKRSGIISKDRKIIIEIINPEHIYTLISKNNKLLIDKDYLKELIEEANEKMQRNDKKIEEFYALIH